MTLESKQWKSARNPANPYDEVGLKHNQLLESFFEAKEGKEFRSDLIDRKKKPLSDYFVPFFRHWPGHFDPGPVLEFSKRAKSPVDWIGFTQKDPSQSFLKYIHLLIEDVNKLPKERVPASEIYSRIIELEATITTDREVSDSEKKSLLMAASGARYSHAYWSDPNNNKWAAEATVDWGRAGVLDAIGCIATPACGGVCSLIDLTFQWFGQ